MFVLMLCVAQAGKRGSVSWVAFRNDCSLSVKAGASGFVVLLVYSVYQRKSKAVNTPDTLPSITSSSLSILTRTFTANALRYFSLKPRAAFGWFLEHKYPWDFITSAENRHSTVVATVDHLHGFDALLVKQLRAIFGSSLVTKATQAKPDPNKRRLLMMLDRVVAGVPKQERWSPLKLAVSSWPEYNNQNDRIANHYRHVWW